MPHSQGLLCSHAKNLGDIRMESAPMAVPTTGEIVQIGSFRLITSYSDAI